MNITEYSIVIFLSVGLGGGCLDELQYSAYVGIELILIVLLKNENGTSSFYNVFLFHIAPVPKYSNQPLLKPNCRPS